MAEAEGERRWVRWPEIDMDASQLPELGAALDRTGLVTLGPVGSAGARLVRQRAAVDFGAGWLQRRVVRQSPA